VNSIRERIERWFETFARALYRNPLKALLVMAIISGAGFFHLPSLYMDTSTEGFLHEDDPALILYNSFRDQFGYDQMILVTVEAEDVFSLDSFARLKALHEDLESTVPYVDDITSLINARDTRGEGDRLVVEDLMERWPRTREDALRIKERVFSNPLYINLLVSPDSSLTTIAIKTNTYSSEGSGEVEEALGGFEELEREDMARETPPVYLTDRENSMVVSAVHEAVARHEGEGFGVDLAGTPFVTDSLKRSMINDMRRFMALALLAIVLFLFVMFRRVTGVVLPVLVVLFSLLSTFGLMAAVGVPIKLPTQILPSFLLAVGIGDSVHVLAIFYRRLSRSGDKEDAVVYAMGHSGLAILMTSLTTAAGLLSFAAAKIAPIADIGYFGSMGVMVALVYTVVLLPALLALMPVRSWLMFSGGLEGGSLDRLLAGIGDIAIGRPRTVLAVSALVIVVAAAGMPRIVFGHYPLHWFPEDSEVRASTEKVDQRLRGSITMEAVVDTGRVNGLYDPGVLEALDRVKRYAERYDDGTVFVGRARSAVDVLKEINRALNEDRPEAYKIPVDRRLIAQEFLLFENSGSDDLEDLVDSRFRLGRFSIKVPFIDAVKYEPFLDAMEREFSEALEGLADVNITGIMTIFSRTIHNVMVTMVRSYVIAFVVISVMLVLLIGKLRMGLLAIIPNMAPIVIVIGLMGWLDFPMDLFTMMLGSIAIGLAVDDTVHFMHNFRRYYESTGDTRLAVRETLMGTGRAMLITTCVLSMGFFIFTMASMQNLFRFGLLTGLAIVLALLADYFMAPALMAIATGYRRERSEVSDA
jgi:predicted RND superfamily exporter protein